MSNEPKIAYWHLWTDADGISRQRRCAMSQFELKSIQPPADPQWLGHAVEGAMTVLFTVLPVGWVGSWHENPRPQWIVPLSGCWFVESMDGQRVQMGCGEISFGADQGCREVQGRLGHRSGTVGDVPAVLMLMQLRDARAPSDP
ncbi:MAG: cupin domain-containing protein, partial [Steroidobacteraceae bacterium]